MVLGGGVFRTDYAAFLRRIEKGICAVAPRAVLRRLEAPPVVGAALIGLDELGAPRSRAAALRSVLTHARLAGSDGGRSRA